MEALFVTSASWPITIIRIVLGIIFFAHGAQKVFGWFGGHGLKGTTAYLNSTGTPLSVAYLVCFFELFGGTGLVLGLLTRPSALAVAIVMVGAIVKVHAANGFFMNWEMVRGRGHGIEANLAFLAMAMACLIAGGGAVAVDPLLVR
jgi:putative oxidoreductase